MVPKSALLLSTSMAAGVLNHLNWSMAHAIIPLSSKNQRATRLKTSDPRTIIVDTEAPGAPVIDSIQGNIDLLPIEVWL